MKRIAFVTTIFLSTLAVLLLLWQLRDVVLIFISSLALASAMTGPVNFLMQRGWSRSWAVLTSFVTVLGGITLFLLVTTLPLINEIDPLARNLILEYHRIQDTILRLSGSQPSLATRLPSTEQLAVWWSGGETGGLLRNLMGLTQSIGYWTTQFLLALVISVYWMMDQMRFERLWLSLLSPEHRIRARDTWRKIESDVGSYLRSEFLQFLLSALLLAPGFWLLDIKQPVMLALFVAFAWLLPLIGAAFAVFAALLIGWLSGLDVALVAGLYTTLILLFLEFYIEPRLYKHERYWNVLIVLVMLVLGDALGWVGLLLAPPVAVAIQILINRLLDVEVAVPVTTNPIATTSMTTTPVAPAPDLSLLFARFESLRTQLKDTQLKDNQEEGALRANNLIARLSKLLGEVEKVAASDSISGINHEPESTSNVRMEFAKNHP